MKLNRRTAMLAGVGALASATLPKAAAPQAMALTAGVDVQAGKTFIVYQWHTERGPGGQIYAVLNEFLSVPGKGLIELPRRQAFLISIDRPWVIEPSLV